MSEHQKQTEFFKLMLQSEGSVEQRQLSDQILKAERDERCVRRAILKIGLLMAISFLGALYTVVIMPEVILNPNHGVRKVFEVLALGSVITFVSYLAFWFYYRALLFQAHTDCRRFMMSASGRSFERIHMTEDPDGNAEMVLTEHAA